MTEPISCDSEIYQKGEPVCAIVEISSEEIEELIISVREFTKQRVDWHYVGRQGVVKVIGNPLIIKHAILAKEEEIKEKVKNNFIKMGLGDLDYYPIQWFI